MVVIPHSHETNLLDDTPFSPLLSIGDPNFKEPVLTTDGSFSHDNNNKRRGRGSRTSYRWVSSDRYIHHIADFGNNEDPFIIYVATDYPYDIGSFGAQTDEIYSSRPTALFYLGHWNGRIISHEHNQIKYFLLLDGHMAEDRRTFLSSTLFHTQIEPLRINREHLWDLADEGYEHPNIFYDIFWDHFQHTSRKPLQPEKVDPEHRNLQPLTYELLVARNEKLRREEERGWLNPTRLTDDLPTQEEIDKVAEKAYERDQKQREQQEAE